MSAKIKNEEIIKKLKSHGISPSMQRIEIYKFIAERRNHPTVDIIYKDIKKIIPTLSKTTIYNTLKLFFDKNLLIEIIIDSNEIRYDADTSIHGHFYCEKCDKIYDFDVDISQINPEFFKNVKEIKEHHIYLKGVCNRH